MGGSAGPLRRRRDVASGDVCPSPLRHLRSLSNCIRCSDHQRIFAYSVGW